MDPLMDRQFNCYSLVLLLSLFSAACSAESPGLSSLGELVGNGVSETLEGGPTQSKSSQINDVRLTRIPPGEVCAEGGVLVEVVSKGNVGSGDVLFEKVECGYSQVAGTPCLSAQGGSCAESDSDHESNGPEGDQPVVEWKPCTDNAQIDCIANEAFAAADFTYLRPENIKDGVTVAGVAGAVSSRPADCIQNGQVGCVSTTLFKAADLSGLIPSSIRFGRTIAGVTGIYPSLNSRLEGSSGFDLPSLASSVPAGEYQFFKSDGTRVEGSISDAGHVVPGQSDRTFSESLYRGFTVAGDSDLQSDSFLAGVNIFGVAGNVALPPVSNVQEGSFFGPGGNTFEGEISVCESAGTVGCLTTDVFKPYGSCTYDGQTSCAANSTYQAWAPVVATVSSGVSEEDEGQSITFNIETTNISDGAMLKYTLSGAGIDSNDITTGQTSGFTSVSGNAASVTVPLRTDYIPEGPEDLTLTVFRELDAASATIHDVGQPATLLLHFDGVNAGTTYTDSTQNNWSMSGFGNASLSSTDVKFGSTSLVLDGTGDYLTTPANSAFVIGTNDFTIDFWCKPSVVSDNDGVFTFGDTSSGLALSLVGSSWLLTNVGGGGSNMGPATAGQWTHIAITRASNQVRMFINGVQAGSTLNWNTNFSGNQLRIGYYYSTSYTFQGRIDEFRFINSSAVWTSNFTPATLPY